MHRAKLCLAVAGCLLVTTTPRLAAQYNGVIQFVSYNDHDGAPDTIVQMTKGSSLRFENMGGHGGAMIMKGNTRTIMMPDRKQYMDWPAEMDSKAVEREASKRHGTAEKTGKTETIAGIPCDDWHYKSTDDDGKTAEGEVCVSHGAGLMVTRMAGPMLKRVFSGGGEAFNEALNSGGGILKVTKNGKVQLLALNAQATTVPDAMFSPPADYTKLDMSQMGKMRKP
jgi:hypothetical protein